MTTDFGSPGCSTYEIIKNGFCMIFLRIRPPFFIKIVVSKATEKKGAFFYLPWELKEGQNSVVLKMSFDFLFSACST